MKGILRPGLRTLECGSGLSTKIFIEAQCDHIALEDDPRYAFNDPCVIVAPLEGKPPWYAVHPRGPFDVVLIDGPAAAKGGRWGIMRVAEKIIGPNSVVILDDTQRAEEKSLAMELQKAFGLSAKELLPKHPLDAGRHALILFSSRGEPIVRYED